MENIVDTLGPFEDITKEVSSNATSAAVILPMLTMLRRLLKREHSESIGIKTMRSKILEVLNERFVDTSNNKTLVLATVLDPRFKDKVFDNEDTVLRANTWLKAELAAVAPIKVGDGTEEPPKKKIILSSSAPRARACLWDLFPSSEAVESTNDAADTSTMIDRYLSAPLLVRSEDPYLWWRQNKNQFLTLSILARKYLSAPASSVPSEQLFSGAGQIYSDNRSRLLAERGEMFLLLKYNLRMLAFDY